MNICVLFCGKCTRNSDAMGFGFDLALCRWEGTSQTSFQNSSLCFITHPVIKQANCLSYCSHVTLFAYESKQRQESDFSRWQIIYNTVNNLPELWWEFFMRVWGSWSFSVPPSPCVQIQKDQRRERPLMRRKSDLPKDICTVTALELHRRAEEMLTTHDGQ